MKIAIIRLSSLGDVLVTSAFLNIFKKRIKNAHITWIVDSTFKQIIKDSPYIDEICDIPLRQSKKQKTLIFDVFKKVRSLDKFDIVLDFQGLLKSAIIGKLLKSNNFVGYSKNGAREKIASIFYTKKVNIDYGEHVLKRQYAILQSAFNWNDDFSLSLLDSRGDIIQSSQKAKNTIAGILDVKNNINVLFILEASKPEKEYPLESFYKVALEMKKIYKNFKIYLIWDKKEDEIKKLGERDSVFQVLPHLNLDEIKSLISRMNLVIGGDTGITHLSWILGIPSITLYGNTPIKRFQLSGKNHISLCQTMQTKTLKGDFSIHEISHKRIVEAIKNLLER